MTDGQAPNQPPQSKQTMLKSLLEILLGTRAQPLHLSKRHGSTPLHRPDDITNVSVQAFHHHEAPSPEEAETSAFLARTWAHSKPRSSSQRQQDGAPSPLQRMLFRHRQSVQSHPAPRTSMSLLVERELLSLLPDLEVAMILVENYFDRIHWFTLLFHQRDFRDKFQNLYGPGPRPSNQLAPTTSRVGYVAVLLAVFATSLQYTNDQQKQLLATHGIESQSLKEKILTGLKLRFLDIISIGSLEVVQMCILLGSYYLYHGEPEMAWPLCGSGLRIAQALNLHRRMPGGDPDDHAIQRSIEERKRAWWAIDEIETFCSMLYGFPVSISDSDCDVAPLNPYDEYSGSMSEEQYATQPNLLFFKCAMSKLSAIVKSALVDLYGTGNGRGQQDGNQASRLKCLIDQVASLNSRLKDWNQGLAMKLKYSEMATEAAAANQAADSPGLSKVNFEEHLFKLQALSLKLAYENARILIHRPLLSFRVLRPYSDAQQKPGSPSDPFQRAMHTCRDAALQISQVGSTAYLREVSETYAIAFVSLHLLTAGVTLCISINLDPLSLKSYESRMGIRRLMQIQTLLKDKSIIAAQGLDITKKLMSLVMAKEVDAMFEVESPTSDRRETASRAAHGSQSKRTDGNTAQAIPEQLATRQVPLAASTDPPLLEGSGLEDEAYSDALDCQFLDFCENTVMTEAVLEYEQGMSLVFWREMGVPLILLSSNHQPLEPEHKRRAGVF
ncbi:hypothetical protein FDECE_8500 [Fusarium decemcellulare]|nr:hypothetical protein FDECE_8500 [Fusarium decemcellulare]